MRKFFTSLLILAATLTYTSYGQIVKTVAGGGEGYAGDSSAATAAELHWPKDVKSDTLGNLFVADANNNVIRKISTSGTITTVAGNGAQAGSGSGSFGGDGGPASAAALYDPSGVFVDKRGNIYIADHLNNRIRKVGTNDTINTIAGTGTAGYTGDGGPASAATLNQPAKVTFDRWGNMYIADAGNNCVRQILPNDTIITVAGTGVAGYSGDGGAATAAQLNHPSDVAVDTLGYIYIADMYNHAIRKVDFSGNITTIAGTGIRGFRDTVAATSALLYDPSGIALDDSGNIFISDLGNARIRKIDSAGLMTTVAGTGTSGYNGDYMAARNTWIQFPEGLTIARSGFLFFADQGNNRIRTFNANRLAAGVSNINRPGAELTIYPNPSNGLFSVILSSTEGLSARMQLADMAGRIVAEEQIVANRPQEITVTAPGIYMLTIDTGSERWVKKVIVR